MCVHVLLIARGLGKGGGQKGVEEGRMVGGPGGERISRGGRILSVVYDTQHMDLFGRLPLPPSHNTLPITTNHPVTCTHFTYPTCPAGTAVSFPIHPPPPSHLPSPLSRRIPPFHFDCQRLLERSGPRRSRLLSHETPVVYVCRCMYVTQRACARA